MNTETAPYTGSIPETLATSQAAAKLSQTRNPTKRQQIFDLIAASRYGRTDDEIQFMLNMNGSTQRPRRRELQLLGLIRPMFDATTGRSITRKTATGHQAVVWVTVMA